jgi:hypothetical protein
MKVSAWSSVLLAIIQHRNIARSVQKGAQAVQELIIVKVVLAILTHLIEMELRSVRPNVSPISSETQILLNVKIARNSVTNVNPWTSVLNVLSRRI